MNCRRGGLIWGPSGGSDWAKHSMLQPTPILRADGRIRVFGGLRDEAGVGRVGYVDVSADDPSRVLAVSPSPVLDIGQSGAFDENGVVPCAVDERDGRLYLFYAGYQLGRKVKFLAFGGLAVSDDGGESFERHSIVPITDRTDHELCFRVIHSILREPAGWRAWYGGGSTFDRDGDRQFPRYDIRHARSPDGIHLAAEHEVCLAPEGDEYRVGRPWVLKRGDRYCMFYGRGSRSCPYRLAYAESEDGIRWARRDGGLRFTGSGSGWDATMQAYPSVVDTGRSVFLFYNGDDYGRAGFGFATIEDW